MTYLETILWEQSYCVMWTHDRSLFTNHDFSWANRHRSERYTEHEDYTFNAPAVGFLV